MAFIEIKWGRDRGNRTELAGTRYGEILHAPMWKGPVLEGRVFGGATAATGVAPGTALGTTGAYSLANPAGSGIAVVIIQASMGYVSGTLGAGMVVHAGHVNPVTTAVSGTAITVRNMLLGGARADGQGLAFTTSTIVAPDIIRPAFHLDASLASTASSGGGRPNVDYVDGAICLAPGGVDTLHGIAAAGSTPLVVFGMIWEEVNI